MSVLPAPEEKAASVQAMFDRIAARYDRVNRVMTFNADQRWRRELVRRIEIGPGDRVLDLACGTGDFSEMCRAAGASAVGLDFSRGMLEVAGQRAPEGAWVQGDALRLPLADGSFDAAVSGFALRNFVSIPPVLHELARVLKPGGRLGLLEVDRPANRAVRAGHSLYFNRVVPRVGGWVGRDAAYRYLPQSAVYLPTQQELVRMLQEAGFKQIRKRSPMFGAIQSVSAVRA
ncbi:MAG TPA: bifunctional demethylmenaquinone methyltransferase/2-methoxy-6-polyprenyl-1,4-benzoquinol methylase UbiE [Tepidiformaceae bacterium]|nr:bifunctional demethylmenaquinone methyltransferase/2-methoxy-6-polyprenyl-1,4-benzoquinol methylase UbiE [Tepidiformaceae bacterium]